MVFLAFGKMQFNVQGVTRNLIPQIENIWFKDLLRCPAHTYFRKQQMKLIKTRQNKASQTGYYIWTGQWITSSLGSSIINEL